MPTNPHLILCNGAPEQATRPEEWKHVEPQLLATFGTKQNVTLEITDLTDRMVEALPPVVHDLMEIATLVYAADQSCKRVAGKTVDWGDKWHRTFRFEIQVREPEFWNRQGVQSALTECLGFLSGDNYDFAFSKLTKPPAMSSYLKFDKTAGLPKPVERVMLFSGGLDSLAGAIDEILVNRRRIALVSHKPVGHVGVKQRDLVAELVRLANDGDLSPLHFPVKANKSSDLEEDHTQRSRSFLYAGMAAAVAQYFSLDDIYFYENGIVSVNLPLCQQELGSRATRTTHPKTLDGFNRIFSLVMKRSFTVHNDLLWLTKQDVLEQIQRSGYAELARETLSCTHTRKFTSKRPHCGLCSQCLSRRVAALGAGLGDNDRADGYRQDVLLAARPLDGDRILAERFVGVARQIEDMTTVDEFNQEFSGQLARITPYLGLPAKTATEKLFKLHHDHAKQVGLVMLEQMQKKEIADARRRGTLPETCVVNYAFESPRKTPVATDGPAQPVAPTGQAEAVVTVEPVAPTGQARAVVDEQTFTITWEGRSFCFTGRSKLLFSLFNRISRRPGHLVSFSALCQKGDVWDDAIVEDTTIRGAVSRLKVELKKAGMASLAAAISTGHYAGRPYVILSSQQTTSNSH